MELLRQAVEILIGWPLIPPSVYRSSSTLQGLQPAAERGDVFGVAAQEARAVVSKLCNILIIGINAIKQVQQDLGVRLAGLFGVREPCQGLRWKWKWNHD